MLYQWQAQDAPHPPDEDALEAEVVDAPEDAPALEPEVPPAPGAGLDPDEEAPDEEAADAFETFGALAAVAAVEGLEPAATPGESALEFVLSVSVGTAGAEVPPFLKSVAYQPVPFS